jgi:hypothetical protein
MSKQRGRTKQPAILSNTLQRNLSLYAFAAGAAGVQLLALAPAADAEVVYTPANITLGRHKICNIDLNHDGVNDFTFSDMYNLGSCYQGAQLDVKPFGVGGIAYTRSEFGPVALVFRKGDKIGNQEGFETGTAMMALKYELYGPPTHTYGPWINVRNGYVGLAFTIDGQLHYGWARIGLRWNGLRLFALIKGYAYETQPNTSITAGDTGSVADEALNEEGQPQFVPAADLAPRREKALPAPLGALAAGAPGLAIWRRRL